MVGRDEAVIIWKGRGGFIALITFLLLLALDGVTGALSGDRQYYASHGWPKLVGFWMAAISVFALRGFLGVPPSARDEPASGQEAPQARPSVAEGELFFVPARYWPAVLALLGVVFFWVRD